MRFPIRNLTGVRFRLVLQGLTLCFATHSSIHAQQCSTLPQPSIKLDTSAAAFTQALLTLRPPSSYMLAPNQYTRGFGFFCKQELKWQKAGFPLKVRTGNPGDCDRLEQKTGAASH